MEPALLKGNAPHRVKNRRILFVTHAAIHGGAATMVANVIRAVASRDFEVHLVCPPGDNIEILRRAGANVLPLPRPLPMFRHCTGRPFFALDPRVVCSVYELRRSRAFWARYFKASGADLVFLCSIVLAPMAQSAMLAGLPAACLVQETQTHGLLGVRNAWLRLLMSTKTVGVCFISRFDQTKWKLASPVQEVIPNWVDVEEFVRGVDRQSARTSLGLSEEHQVVLFLGGSSEIKGVFPLLRAMLALADMDRLRLIIGGYSVEVVHTGLPTRSPIVSRFVKALRSHDIRKEFVDLLNSPDIARRTLLSGATENVARLYAAADLVVFPAVRPHQGRPILEAGAFELPVVVSDFECLREFVHHEATGLLVRPGDPQALAGAIRRIMCDAALARKLGKGNSLVTREQHSGGINAPRMASFFQAVMDHHYGNRSISHK